MGAKGDRSGYSSIEFMRSITLYALDGRIIDSLFDGPLEKSPFDSIYSSSTGTLVAVIPFQETTIVELYQRNN